MYDFTVQKEMMIAANYLLKKHGLSDVSALGGGTALAAYYWKHRYSTDIDIFTHSEVDISLLFRPAKWDGNFKNIMKKLDYKESKVHPIYTEFTIKDNFKMQFLSTTDKTNNPYQLVRLWDMDILLESVEEIIAKKIYFRAHKGNARDLFDISIAIHKDPSILNKLLIPNSKLEELQNTVETIIREPKLLDEYLYEIGLMNPNTQYNKLAFNCINYLKQFLDSYLEAKKLSINLNDSELIEIEKYIYYELSE